MHIFIYFSPKPDQTPHKAAYMARTPTKKICDDDGEPPRVYKRDFASARSQVQRMDDNSCNHSSSRRAADRPAGEHALLSGCQPGPGRYRGSRSRQLRRHGWQRCLTVSGDTARCRLCEMTQLCDAYTYVIATRQCGIKVSPKGCASLSAA